MCLLSAGPQVGSVSPGVSLNPSNSHGGGSYHWPPSPSPKMKVTFRKVPGWLSQGLLQAGNEPGFFDSRPMLGTGRGGANGACTWAAPPSKEEVVCTGLAATAQGVPMRPRAPPGARRSLETVSAHRQAVLGPGLPLQMAPYRGLQLRRGPARIPLCPWSGS